MGWMSMSDEFNERCVGYNKSIQTLVMKKIKYGSKKNQPENRQLQNLKQGDEICEAVFDTLSDDYLSYINNLVKNAKPSSKKQERIQQEYPSSDSQQDISQHIHQSPLHILPKQQHKNRHHSQTGARTQPASLPKPELIKEHIKSVKNQSLRSSPIPLDRHQIKKDEMAIIKGKKKKIEFMKNQSLVKNQQKTMAFSRNVAPQYEREIRKTAEYLKQTHTQSKQHLKLKNKYKTNNTQEEDMYSEDSQNVSIKMSPKPKGPKKSEASYRFITNISDYIANLEANISAKQPESHNYLYKSRQKPRKSEKPRRNFQNYDQEFSREEVDELLKENMKLKKKVKTYQQKIQDLQDEITSHLIQCKQKDTDNKNKIANLIKGLTQAVSKINTQKTQINDMKNLLRTFGQKVKQIENQNDEDSQDMENDISDSVMKLMGPKRHSSDLRTKHKKGLDWTMPKHQEDRNWKE